MLKEILNIIAILIIWAACFVGRDKKSNIILFSKNWWFVTFLIFVAVTILKHNN